MSEIATKFMHNYHTCPICSKSLDLIIDFGSIVTYKAVLYGIDGIISFFPNSPEHSKYSIFEYDTINHNFMFDKSTNYLLGSSFKLVYFCSSNDNNDGSCYYVVSKKYEQGMVHQIEYIQARNEFTNASIYNIIAVFDCYIKEALLERASATFKFGEEENRQ